MTAPAGRNCRSTRRIACIARRATSRSPIPTRSPGSPPRADLAPTIKASEEIPTVAARWRAEVAARRLQYDAVQERAAARLDRLALELHSRRDSWIDGLRARLG